MKVPTRLQVAGKSVRFEYVEEIADEGGHPVFGETIEGDLHIKISKTRPLCEEHVWSTILHELCHVVLEVSGVSQVLTEKKEEAVCHALDNLLAPLLWLRIDLVGASWKDITFEFEESDK